MDPRFEIISELYFLSQIYLCSRIVEAGTIGVSPESDDFFGESFLDNRFSSNEYHKFSSINREIIVLRFVDVSNKSLVGKFRER